MDRQAVCVGSLTCAAATAAIVAACSAGSPAPSSAGDAAATDGTDDGAIALDAMATDAVGDDATSPPVDDGEVPALDSAAEGAVADAAFCQPSAAAGVQCNTLAASGAPISVACNSAQPLPMPTAGGAVENGQYVLTSSTYYGPCPAPETDRITWLICGSSWQTLQESTLNGSTTSTHLNAVVSTSGSRATFDLNCGLTEMMTFGYDATTTTLTLYQPSGTSASVGRVDTFTRRP